MKFSRSCLTLAALFAAVSLQVQAQTQSVPAPKTDTGSPRSTVSGASDVGSKPVSATKKDAAAAAKPTKEQLNEVHTVAVMVIEFGGEEHQVMFELLGNAAPKTVQNFVSNAEKGIYTGMAFHRSVDDYLVQTGDPVSKDDASRDNWGLSQEYTIPGEFKLPHVTGAVAMARRGDKMNPKRQSDGTQFYFVLGNMSALNGQYTVFGQVYSGLDALKKLSRVATDSNDCPLERVEIKSLKVIEQKGPLVSVNSKGKKSIIKSEAGMNGFEKFLYRVW
ncbi:cyclophilin family peptidyl-prolyl cis-trans isomerase [Roseimicrobium gellanilyticum]|uniref:Peptidyl-prolyl cis-trans isomerase n=1 Tax=Roseimicrobium gellanilyticum TaxID=748857 RepID=A0A366HT75_9BACT|nr:peptidylprolyl isomerase [Roseimicrobium gellanilyticum]RBP47287.1 cyclophilin family peptidyl-prolyl cis-trans isomerase [Roseimicrobium gellanilyticum]